MRQELHPAMPNTISAPADTPRMKRREHTYRDMYVTDDKKIKAISSISGKAAIHKARKKDMMESNLTE